MSLLGFQRALADFVASPELCAAPEAVLRSGDLTARERDRLETMLRDPLMATNCTLYRVNRITPVYVYFPMTCQVLGASLRDQLDAFWSVTRGADLQYVPETRRFAEFLKRQPHANDFLEEIVDYEAALMELRFSPGPGARHVRFSHHPARLLDALSSSNGIPSGVDAGEYWVEVTSSNGELVSRIL